MILSEKLSIKLPFVTLFILQFQVSVAQGPQRALRRLQEPSPPREQDHPQDPDHVGLHAAGTEYILSGLNHSRHLGNELEML